MNNIYLSIDGDDVGRKLEYFMLINDSSSLIEFSEKFQKGMFWLEEKLVKDFKGVIIFTGGDNLLVSLNSDSIINIESLRSDFHQRTGSTLSVGFGNSPRQAYFALKLAKTSGKNRVCNFQEISD